MTLIEHILVTIAEEAGEVVQAASKALRFGLEDCKPEQELTNEQHLWNELSDLMAMAELLKAQRNTGSVSWSHMLLKKERFAKWLEHSKVNGTLTEYADPMNFDLTTEKRMLILRACLRNLNEQ